MLITTTPLLQKSLKQIQMN